MTDTHSYSSRLTRIAITALAAVLMAAAVSAIIAFAARAPMSAVASSAACPSGSFLNVTAHAKNSAYPAPRLSVTCTATHESSPTAVPAASLTPTATPALNLTPTPVAHSPAQVFLPWIGR
jgi:hypothetical protein